MASLSGFELAVTVADAMITQWGWSESQAGDAAALVLAVWLNTCSNPDGD